MSSDVQRGVVLKVSSVRVKRDRETFKLKSSKAPPCPPPPSLQVALLPLPPDTETGPLLPKRPVRLRARQGPPPLRLKLTRGALTTLIVGLVSSAGFSVSLAVRSAPSTCTPAWRMCSRPKVTHSKVIRSRNTTTHSLPDPGFAPACVLFLPSVFPGCLYICFSEKRRSEKQYCAQVTQKVRGRDHVRVSRARIYYFFFSPR